MDKFNNQFATRKLRQEADNNWPETITSRYQDEYLFIHDENKPGFYNVKDLDTGKIVGRFGFKTPENAVEFAKDKIKPQSGRQSSGLGETSMTSAGATFTPGDGEQTAPRATKKVVKKKLTPEEKDVEPKLAAGKANIYAKEKWGWTPAPSIPNRPSKGGFIYKQLFEELSSAVNEINGRMHIGTDTKTDSDIYFEPKTGAFYINIIDPAGNRTNKLQVNTIEDVLSKFPNFKWTKEGEIEFQPEEQDDDEDRYDWFTDTYTEEIKHEDKVKIVDPKNKYFGRTGKVHDIHDDNSAMIIIDVPGNPTTTVDISKLKAISGINENYSRFKNETKTRNKPEQFHQAIREVRKKVQEINRLFEYVSRLKTELSEGEGGLKYKVHTEKALQKIKEMVSELNQNIKKFK